MIIEIALSLIFYWVLLLSAKRYVKLPIKRTEQGYEPLSRPVCERTFVLYVSLVHGAISTFLMFYCYFEYDHNPERPLHYMEEIAFSHTLGYMIYDMLAHYFCNALDIFIIWHHTAAGFMLIGMLLRPQCIYILCFTIGAAEITHPCHIARIMFDLTNVKKDSKLNVLNTFAFGIPFLLFRAILCTKHFYFGFTYRQGSIILKALSIASHSLCIDWCIQVFFLLWKMFPYLFKNSEIIENYAIWKKGREFMVMLTKDPKISAYFKSVEFSLTIGLPFVLSILYSPYGIY